MRIERRTGGQRPLLLDGAVGTELIARGLELDREPPEAWLVARPEILRALHEAYVAAGADLLQTNTFGASAPRLRRSARAGDVALLNRLAVELARAASRGRPVFASLGPTGIDPFSDGAAAIAAAYDEQLDALVRAGVDGLHFETMYHPLEATLGLAAARRAAPRLPVIVSATYALGDQGFQTPLGVPLDQMMRALDDTGPDAIGINCSLEARKMTGLVERARSLTELPLVVQPQGGPAEIDCRAPRSVDAAAQVAEFVRGSLALLDCGADALGGCCGAGPAHIAALARALGG